MWPNKTSTAVINEISELKKILYMGPWYHIEPTMFREFKQVEEFVYIDTQPRSEWDTMSFKHNDYKPEFVNSLIEKCKNYGYELINKTLLDDNYHKNILSLHQTVLREMEYPDINPCLYEFKNKYNDKTLKYYISTNIEYNMTAKLQKDIETSDGMMISGYFPPVFLKNYFPKPKALICFTDTVYPEYLVPAEEQDNDIISNINYMSDVDAAKYFNSYYICSYFTSHISKCVNLIEIREKSIWENEYSDHLVTVDIL